MAFRIVKERHDGYWCIGVYIAGSGRFQALFSATAEGAETIAGFGFRIGKASMANFFLTILGVELLALFVIGLSCVMVYDGVAKE